LVRPASPAGHINGVLRHPLLIPEGDNRIIHRVMPMDAAQQLDIFADSRDTMLRNDVLRALENRDSVDARRALLTLSGECPHDGWLKPLRQLVDFICREPGGAIRSHDELQRDHATLSEIELAARKVLPVDSVASWLAPSWADLARRADGLPFESSAAQGHAAPLWLNAGEWAAAERAVTGIESWRRIPAPLGWMAEVRWRLAGLDAAWPLLAELAWLAPERFRRCTQRIHDPVLARLLARFNAEFEGEGTVQDDVWFPAWSLVHDNLLGPAMGLAQAGLHSRAERTFRAVLGLLALERRGAHRELVEARRTFRDLHGGLYASYMKTR
jgi:hypothetical protein